MLTAGTANLPFDSQFSIQSVTQIQRSPNGAITNPLELSVDEIVHQRVLCPACEEKIFEMWPEGWDAHAAFRCTGVTAPTPETRKADFKRRFSSLFR
ncbi:MAG: hypothetical protein JWL97_801 [Gemmatimonadales bacterium]|jgi:hypothetical protein|nr:hypothetical protein [Gemmatimonadales bacterium]